MFAIVYIAILIIFKNRLFYSEQLAVENSGDESMYVNYSIEDNNHIPTQDAYMLIDTERKVINHVTLSLGKGLPCDSCIKLYIGTDSGDVSIEDKIVRKGYKRVSFYFEKREANYAKVFFLSEKDKLAIPLSDISVAAGYRYLDLVRPENWGWIIGMLAAFSFSMTVAVLFTLYDKKNKNSINLPNSRIARQSNFELLRIICMFLIICHHYAVHGGLLSQPAITHVHKVGLFFLPFGKICFDAFIAISMWFLVDSYSAKFERFFKMWMQVFLYSVIFTIISYLFGGKISYIDFIGSMFVMTGNSHGFAASYLLFLLLLPFIIRATKNINKSQARYLLIIVFMIQVGSQIVGALIHYYQPIYSEVTLFVLCYILSINLKKWPIKEFDSKMVCCTIIVITWMVAFIVNGLAYLGLHTTTVDFICRIIGDESSLFYIAAGYSLFYLVKDIHVPYCKAINAIASVTFGVLLIHDHNYFRHIFWYEIVRIQQSYNARFLIFRILLTSILIFFSCGVIDYFRQILVEKPLLRLDYIKRLCEKMNEVYSFDEESKK